MGRSARELFDGCSFLITLRCNSGAFLIARGVRRDLLLAVLRKAQEKFGFRLDGICLMANHLHLLLQPAQGRNLPRIMQWIDWYSVMALNRLTGRCGHFWEARYFSTPIDPGDTRRVLATLRPIHANPKAAGVRKGFHDHYSNYGHYVRLDGDVPALCAVLPALPAKGEADPQRSLGQQAAATGWRQWPKGCLPQRGGRRPAGSALGWRVGATAAAAMAAAGGNIQAGKEARASDWEANLMV